MMFDMVLDNYPSEMSNRVTPPVLLSLVFTLMSLYKINVHSHENGKYFSSIMAEIDTIIITNQMGIVNSVDIRYLCV